MKQPALLLAVVVVASVLSVVTAATPSAHRASVEARDAYRKRVKIDPYRDFAGDKELEIADEPDDKPPSDFAGDVKQASITNAETRQYGKGKFKNSFETQNGIQVSQVGKLRDDKVFVVMGSYSYTGADGRRYRVKYTADEFGYHPITELDLDIPELELELKPAARAPAPVRASAFGPASKFGAAGAAGLNGGAKGSDGSFGANGAKGANGAANRGANGSSSKFGANGAQGANGSNGSRTGSSAGRPQSDGQFTYGKATPPPSSVFAHTYLPPNGYLPPATYLPPVGVKPTKRP